MLSKIFGLQRVGPFYSNSNHIHLRPNVGAKKILISDEFLCQYSSPPQLCYPKLRYFCSYFELDPKIFKLSYFLLFPPQLHYLISSPPLVKLFSPFFFAHLIIIIMIIMFCYSPKHCFRIIEGQQYHFWSEKSPVVGLELPTLVIQGRHLHCKTCTFM